MPNITTLRKYYPNSKLNDEKLMTLAKFVQEMQETKGISPDNRCLKMLVAWEESKL